MDLPSMLTTPARIALTPARLILQVFFAAGDRWLSTPAPTESDVPDLLDADDYWINDPVMVCPHAGARCIWFG